MKFWKPDKLLGLLPLCRGDVIKLTEHLPSWQTKDGNRMSQTRDIDTAGKILVSPLLIPSRIDMFMLLAGNPDPLSLLLKSCDSCWGLILLCFLYQMVSRSETASHAQFPTVFPSFFICLSSCDSPVVLDPGNCFFRRGPQATEKATQLQAMKSFISLAIKWPPRIVMMK